MLQFNDFVGFIGIGLIVGSYLLLQLKRISSDGLVYSISNCIGALCVIYSLMYKFNLSAFIVEVFWVLISLIGIIRYCLREKQDAPSAELNSENV